MAKKNKDEDEEIVSIKKTAKGKTAKKTSNKSPTKKTAAKKSVKKSSPKKASPKKTVASKKKAAKKTSPSKVGSPKTKSTKKVSPSTKKSFAKKTSPKKVSSKKVSGKCFEEGCPGGKFCSHTGRCVGSIPKTASHALKFDDNKIIYGKLDILKQIRQDLDLTSKDARIVSLDKLSPPKAKPVSPAKKSVKKSVKPDSDEEELPCYNPDAEECDEDEACNTNGRCEKKDKAGTYWFNVKKGDMTRKIFATAAQKKKPKTNKSHTGRMVYILKGLGGVTYQSSSKEDAEELADILDIDPSKIEVVSAAKVESGKLSELSKTPKKSPDEKVVPFSNQAQPEKLSELSKTPKKSSSEKVKLAASLSGQTQRDEYYDEMVLKVFSKCLADSSPGK